MFSYNDDDDDESFVVSDFFKLERSTGSEVLQSDLQRQIDGAADRPDLFVLNKQDASHVEKVAMSTVPEQLPRRAVEALSAAATAATGSSSTTTTKKKSVLNDGSARVTQEQEIALAKIVQKGAALQNLRKDLTAELGRNPTKQEWAERANLTTAALRRQVSDYRTAKHQLVTANIGLVHAVVNQLWRNGMSSTFRASGISKEELVQEGSLGLLRAAELFDPSRGLRFSTYAVVWIKGTLSNSQGTELVRVPGRERTKYNKIVRARRDLEEQTGKEPEPESVAEMTGMSVEQVMVTQRRMAQAQRVLSLDYAAETQSRSGMESGQMHNALEKDRALQADVDLAERTQFRADIVAAMARNLDEREARLMRLRYGLSGGEPMSLHDCANSMGLSYTRVHQLASRCLKKLREAAEVEALEEYLLTIA